MQRVKSIYKASGPGPLTNDLICHFLLRQIYPVDKRGWQQDLSGVYLPQLNQDLQGGVRFPTGGKAHEPQGMIR